MLHQFLCKSKQLHGYILDQDFRRISIVLPRETPARNGLGTRNFSLGDSHDFVDITRHSDALSVPGVAIFRPNAPLFFANADACFGEITDATRQYPTGTTVILSLEESDDLDSSAVEAIVEFDKTLNANGMDLHLTRVHDRVRDLLAASGLPNLARQATHSVADAVDFVHKKEN